MRVRWAAVLGTVVMLGAACSWGQAGYDAGRAGWSRNDNVLTTADVGSLALSWRGDGAATNSYSVVPTVMDGQRVFLLTVPSSSGNATLSTFASDGGPDCGGTPRVCSPTWTATLPFENRTGTPPVVADGRVYVGGGIGTDAVVLGFDAAGSQGCSGSPLVCTPVWKGTWNAAPLFTPRLDLAVADGRLYASTPDLSSQLGAPPSITSVLDLSTHQGCSGSAPEVCTPRFSASTDRGGLPPVVVDGVLYLGSSTGASAFDATGATNCSGTPRTCQPLRTFGAPAAASSLAVSDGLVLIGNLQDHSGGAWVGNVYGFDANGVQGCSGSPAACLPRFGAPGTVAQFPLFASGKLYTAIGDPTVGMTLSAADITGGSGCVGMLPFCSAARTAALPTGFPRLAANQTLLFTLVPGNGVPGTGRLRAYSLSGQGCSGQPVTCAPLLDLGGIDPGAVGLGVAGGTVAVSGSSPLRPGPAVYVYARPS